MKKFSFISLLACGSCLVGCENLERDARQVANSLAMKMSDDLVEANLPPCDEFQEVIPDYEDPWGNEYIAHVSADESFVTVVIASKGENGVTDERKMILSGSNAGRYKQGDDILVWDRCRRPGDLARKVKGGVKSLASAVTGGMVEGVVEESSTQAKKIGLTIKEIVKNMKGND